MTQNLFTIQAGGKTYQRRAWTGGDTPDKLAFATPGFIPLYIAFIEDEIKDFGRKPDKETLEIFCNRAELDAWRTLNP